MIPEGGRWEEARALFEVARALPPSRHGSFLDEACPDTELRRDVEALLRAHAALQDEAEADFLGGLDPQRTARLLASAGAVHPDLDDLRAGDAFGRYEIVRRLGQGGMGVVYLARDTRLDRLTALKVLPPHLSLDRAARQRLEQEARTASRLDHPNIATVYEIGDAHDGRVFIAMPFYAGDTLRQELAGGPLPVPRALALASQLAAGLAAAHRRGIVHRDLKPGNVVVTPDGVAKIIDFGIAKITGSAPAEPEPTPGTVAYMSPEQTRGQATDARSDLWSLGVVLYEMLAGERPFAGDDQEVVIAAIRDEEPPPLTNRRADVPPALVPVVRRCLAKDAGERYGTADELGADLASLQERLRGTARRKRAMLVAVALAAVTLAVSIGGWLARGSERATVAGPAASVAVLPPTPVSGDSALVRLGRELGITLSATLDGMGGLRTLSAGTVLGQVGQRTLSVHEGAALAGRLGATSVLHGTLLRSSAQVRLDLTLSAVDGLEPLARVAVTGSEDDVTALTDSATVLLLQRIWSRGRAPVPSLAAITTRSIPALRAYLEGELALTQGEYESAVVAFERAFAADSTFWLAYWRSLYPRVYEGSRADSAVLIGMLAHRDRLPELYRLLLDAYAAETLGARLALLRTVTKRFPTYWPGWYDYADALLHFGPYLGSTYTDTRRAMERVVALDPGFASAWQHLLWTAVRTRDTAAAGRALGTLDRLASATAIVSNPDNLTYYRTLHGVARAGGELGDEAASELARVAVRSALRVPPETVGTDLLAHGFPRAQLALADAVLRARPPREVAAAQWMARAFAWAARGAWDSALVAADEWVRQSDDPQTALRAYGLAVLGRSAGAVDDEAALRLRPDPARSARARSPDEHAELLWLDGILGYIRGDVPAIGRVRRELAATGSASAALLGSSLDAFHRHASGDRAGAAQALASLEWEFAQRELPAPRRAGTGNLTVARYHPYLSAIHRPAAARWVLEAGDTLQALRLLTWHEAVLAGDPIYVRMNAANRVVEPLALYERARLEEARGRVQDAREHYQAFLERYDLPPTHHDARVAAARAALGRLAAAHAPAGPR